MTKEESISVISEIKGLLIKRGWFTTDATASNPNGSNTYTHIHMTRFFWWEEYEEWEEDTYEEKWDIHFDEDVGYITIEYMDLETGVPLIDFIDETNLEKGKLDQCFRRMFTRKPGYGRAIGISKKSDI